MRKSVSKRKRRGKKELWGKAWGRRTERSRATLYLSRGAEALRGTMDRPVDDDANMPQELRPMQRWKVPRGGEVGKDSRDLERSVNVHEPPWSSFLGWRFGVGVDLAVTQNWQLQRRRGSPTTGEPWEGARAIDGTESPLLFAAELGRERSTSFLAACRSCLRCPAASERTGGYPS